MVLPMRQSQQPLQSEAVQPIHQQMQNPVVTSIKRSIYSHVNDLIAQNEERPEQLARIYRDLQSINNRQTASVTPSEVGVVSEALANLNMSSTRATWDSMYHGAEDDGLIEPTDSEVRKSIKPRFLREYLVHFVT